MMHIFPQMGLQNERDLRRYVARTTILCFSIALAVDVANQLIFFSSWPDSVRSWLLTVVVVVTITVPVSHKNGRAQVTLYHVSTTDELTGLLNRRAFFLDGADDGSFLALIIVDLDHFKHVNDRYGHWIGDRVLQATATMMEQSVGRFGRVGRLGGEEFALLAHGDDPAVLLRQLKCFRQSIAMTPILADTIPVSITISVGVATRKNERDFEDLFVRADQALYRAKSLGRNKIVLAEETDVDGDALGFASRFHGCASPSKHVNGDATPRAGCAT